MHYSYNGFFASGFIEISPNVPIWVSDYLNRVYVYDANKLYLGYRPLAAGDQGKTLADITSDFTNAAFVRLQDELAKLEGVSFRTKEDVTPIDGYLENPISRVKEEIEGKARREMVGNNILNELLNPMTVRHNTDINGITGKDVDYTGWFASDFIPVDITKPIYINSYLNRIYAYDSDGIYIGRVLFTNGNTIKSIGGSYINTTFVRIIDKEENLDSASLRYNPFRSSYNPVEGYMQEEPLKLKVAAYNVGDYTGSTFEPESDEGELAYRNAIANEGIDIIATQMDVPYYKQVLGEELFNANNISQNSTLDNNTGAVISYNGWFVSEFIPVNANNIVVQTSYANRVYCYREANENSYIGYRADITNRSIASIEGDFVNTKYVRLEWDNANLNNTTFKQAQSGAEQIFGMFKYFYQVGNSLYNYKGLGAFYSINNVQKVLYTDDTYNHPYFLVGEILIKGKNILLASIHFDWADNSRRIKQIQQVIDYADNYDYAVIMGDTNCEDRVDGQWVTPGGLTYETDWAYFTNAGYSMANNGYFGLFNTYIPDSDPLDNIFVKGFNIKNAYIKQKEWMNDHCMLVADLVCK